MPTQRKKNRRLASKRTDGYVPDVTINDFANSWRTTARFKKAVLNISSESAKQEATMQDEVKDSWEEWDEDYNGTKVKRNGKGMSTSQRRNRKGKTLENEKEEEEGGIHYPLDIWFIISEYISPEAVGKFALICRDSYYVTTTGKFWFHLYKSYYTFNPKLPVRLQPQCMVRTHGLRACVIRVLHHTYFASKRQQDTSIMYFHKRVFPYSLVKRRCCVMWHRKDNHGWHFLFKLKEVPKSSSKSSRDKMELNTKKTDFLEMLEDIAVNPEEGCKLLKVTCQKYIMLPPVIGLILQDVSIVLMSNMKHHKLHLRFGTSEVPSSLTQQAVLNDVISYDILDWWHPGYPYYDSDTVELPQNDCWD